MRGSTLPTAMPSSSSSSRRNASADASPGSHLPPGNSHSPARCLPGGRSVSRMRFCASRRTPATTWTTSATAAPLVRSGQLAVALLVLLARTAGAGVVAAYFRLVAQHLRHGRRGGGGGLARGFAHRLDFRRHRQTGGFGVLELERAALGLAALAFLHRGDFGLALDADARQARDDLGLHAFEHRLEQLEGLALELLLGLLLRVAAQIDALAQVVHGGEMLLPVLVQHLEQEELLGRTHDLRAVHRLLLAEEALDFLDDVIAHVVGVEIVLLLGPVLDVELEHVLRFERAIETREVPLLVDAVGRHEAAAQVAEHVVADIDDVLGDALGIEQFVALLVDDLALVVRGVVEFEQMLADIEVVRLDLALRLLDHARDHAVFERLVLLHAEELHPARDPVGREDAHEAVFEREIETARARVALASRTAAQLVVDAPRFVALRADDVQAAGGEHFVVALLPLGLDAFALGVLGLGRQGRELGFERTAQHDVGTAAGHVRGDRHGARAARLGDDVRLALVLLRVEHLVRDFFLLQQFGQKLGGLDRGGADQHGLTAAVAIPDVLDDRFELVLLLEEDDVLVVLADHRLVGRDHDDFEAVDLLELVGFGVGRAGHARKLAVHAEIVLE